MASVRVPQPRERRITEPAPPRLRRLEQELSYRQETALSAIALEQPSLTAARKPDLAILFAIAAAIALLHLLTNGRYGFHRDELQFLSTRVISTGDSFAYPPFTPFIEHIGLAIFGVSLVWLRLFSVLAQASVVIVAGLMAKDLGGSRLAQITAALAVAPFPVADLRRPRISIHLVRSSLVGAHRLLHRPSARV